MTKSTVSVYSPLAIFGYFFWYFFGGKWCVIFKWCADFLIRFLGEWAASYFQNTRRFSDQIFLESGTRAGFRIRDDFIVGYFVCGVAAEKGMQKEMRLTEANYVAQPAPDPCRKGCFLLECIDFNEIKTNGSDYSNRYRHCG